MSLLQTLRLLDKNLEELSQDDQKLADRIRRLEKDLGDLLVYLNVERKETWIEDAKFNPPQPKLISSKWIKRNEQDNCKSVKRNTKGKARS